MSSFQKDHEERKAIQFIVYDNSDESKFSFRFISDVLKEILTKEEVADLPIAIYSVAGKLRSGKSFLLNLFIHLLQSGTLNHENLDLYQPSFGFPWRGGSVVHTNGMWIIDEPFILQKSDGTKFALFLMDTEGTDEPFKSRGASNAVFSISTLLSSFQIFNIKNPFAEDDLRKLHLCSSLGKHCTKDIGYLQEAKTFVKGLGSNVVRSIKEFGNEKTENNKSNESRKEQIAPFQNLLFLIRDYPGEEIEENGDSFKLGENILKRMLNEKNSTDQEVRVIRKHIKNAFHSINCYAVRSPGEKATERSQKSKPCLVKDLNPDFLLQIKTIFDHLFNEENIVIKKINGQPMTCSLFFEYTQLILSLYKSGKVPQAVDVIQATDDATMTKAKEIGRKKYNTRMKEISGTNYIKESNLKEFHEQCKEGVMSEILTIQCLGSEETRKRHIDEFQQDLENLWNFKKRENEMLKIKVVQDIYKISDGVAEEHKSNLKMKISDTAPLSKEDFAIFVNSETEKSMKKFEEQTEKYKHYDDLLEQPSADIKKKLKVKNDSSTLKNSNKWDSAHLRFEAAENELTQEYEQSMEKKCYSKLLQPLQFLDELKAKENIIFEKFDERFRDISESFKNVYRSQLQKEISEKKKHYQNLNMSFWEGQRKDSVIMLDIENYYKNSMRERLGGVYKSHDEFEATNEESTKKAFKYAESKLGSNFQEHSKALSTTFHLFKENFIISNNNIKKNAQAHFKKQMEICYEEYDHSMKRMVKEENDAEMERKHNECKDEAIHIYNKHRGEPEEDFLLTKSHLEEKIQKRGQILKDENELYKAEEDRKEEAAWKFAISEYERKKTETINQKKSKRSETVKNEFRELENNLLKGYKGKVAKRFFYKEKKLKEEFQSIFAGIPEPPSSCVIS